MITIFTPTYNRAHLLPRLYESLRKQTSKNFEWLIIDDGSTDGTHALFDEWTVAPNEFTVRYSRVANGGKQRAINQAVALAEGEYFLIVDSDDLLCPTAVQSYIDAFKSLPEDESFIGISFLRGNLEGKPLGGNIKIDPVTGFVDANNLQRPYLGLSDDMAEAFFTEKLRKYPFPVWKGEKFTPEAVVWDKMALDGYKIRWYDRVEYLCEYQAGGLSDSSWKLLKQNPMGYAMLFDAKLRYEASFRNRLNLSLQYDSCCCLAHEYCEIARGSNKIMKVAASPLGWLLSRRRKRQFNRFDTRQMDRHKVLFLIESLVVGGAERVLVNIVNKLDPKKFDITVSSIFKYSVYDSYQAYFDKPFASHIHYKYLINNHNKPIYHLFNALLRRYPKLLYRLFIGDGYDSVVAFYEGLPTDLVSQANLKRGGKCAWLHTTTSLSQAGKSFVQLERQSAIYSAFDKIVAVSRIVKDSFTETFPSVNVPITIICNPLDRDAVLAKAQCKIAPMEYTRPLFVAVGRLTAAKGFDRWLRCLGKLRRKGYDFMAWIIGGGDSSELESIILEEGLSGTVALLGHKSNPFPFLKLADWIIAPSRAEGLPAVIQESIALGKAIMGTKGTGIAELLKDGETGMLVDNSSEGIEAGMEKILMNPSLKEAYEKKASEYSRTYSSEEAITKIENLLIS
ncbi:MAG: glycosyltransferase [Bacteroidales bacterium]|nr:glycosyltransferase [Bacteroidales bacterium]